MAELVKVDLDDVYEGLDALVRAGRDLRPVWREVRGGLRGDLKNHFDQRQGPEGAWAPPAASTIERLLRQGGRSANINRKGQLKRRAARRLANQLGRLKSAWTIAYTRGSLTGESKAPWSGIHQDGGVAGRGARIPARPFAWVTDSFLGVVADSVLKYLGKAWG